LGENVAGQRHLLKQQLHGAGLVAGEAGKLGGMDCRAGGEAQNHLGTGSDPN
jgi:hypothetical protein